MIFPKKLYDKLRGREQNNSLRKLRITQDLVDFSSNDYLGFASSKELFKATQEYLHNHKIFQNGSGGSRLLTGNHPIHEEVEQMLCEYHNSQAALVFNSGYDANMGLLSSVPQRGDLILFDELSHASIREGIRMSNAKSYKFDHNNLEHLESLLSRHADISVKYVVTESVFSMDGDSPDLEALVNICKEHHANLILDEAHAIGVIGEKSMGLTQALNMENEIFARIITFGKAIGSHGAAVLGSNELKSYLVNFTRSFIYTTALPPHSMANILVAYAYIESAEEKKQLAQNIDFFHKKIKELNLESLFIPSCSAIHCALIPGNNKVKSVSEKLMENGFDVRPILSPTVQERSERLRFCLHSFNSEKEIDEVLSLLVNFAL